MTTKGKHSKVLIVVFDALRPEFVRSDLMPNLLEFAATGVRYINSRSTFPTETRVNQTAVLTGCYPRKHGIVGNRFPLPGIKPPRVVNTGEDAEIAEAFSIAGDAGLITMPTMGERLHVAGRSFAALSAGTPGGGRLINHLAEQHGTFRLAMRCPETSCPVGVLEKITAKIGPMPVYKLPATDWIIWAVDAYLEYVLPEVDPDVMLLWLCEPDESFHFLGIGEPRSLETIRNADAQFGRILAQHSSAIERGELHVIAMSDHGQISLGGERLELIELMTEAGFSAAASPSEHADYTVVAGNAGGIWVRESDESKTAKLVDWLEQQDWCGALFTHTGTAGTLRNAEVCMDHSRAPDICINMRYGDDLNTWGVAGVSRHDAPYPVGGGCHGGLSPHELENVLILSGKQFEQGVLQPLPAGNVDVLHTVLHLLGLPPVRGIDGRILSEAFVGLEPEAEAVHRSITSPSGHTHLSYTEYGKVRYLNGAWV